MKPRDVLYEILTRLADDRLFLGHLVCKCCGHAPLPSDLQAEWDITIARVFAEAALKHPDVKAGINGGRMGQHGAEMGHLLAELQYVQRADPETPW